MSTEVIIVLCSLLLIAYIFDLSASKTKIPSVILLLGLGLLVKKIVDYTGLNIPDLSPLLPVLGTIGLILIVLEGSMELKLEREKKKMLISVLIISVVPFAIFCGGLTWLIHHWYGIGIASALLNVIPLAIISSAIAIPSVKKAIPQVREFITYESSLSDIVGIMVFNFMLMNEEISLAAFGDFGIDFLIILLISLAGTIGLSLMLNRIDHHIKFTPIILLVILVYALTKIYHLPGLVFILIFGIFLSNLDLLQNFSLIRRFRLDELNDEVHKFHEITTEGAFLIRSTFFLLFGYLINIDDLLNEKTIYWAIGIVAAAVLLRLPFMMLFKQKLLPSLFIAPRGLITILLFFSIPENKRIFLINDSLIIQVIILSAIAMMIGFFLERKKVSDIL